jgi:hypothetical protein
MELFPVRKLIAVLECKSAIRDAMKSWMEDRLYMYDSLFAGNARGLLVELEPRLADTLVLCIGRESIGNSELERTQSIWNLRDVLISRPNRFSLLFHSTQEDEPDNTAKLAGDFTEWHVRSTGPLPDLDSVGRLWYPALKNTIYEASELAGIGVAGQSDRSVVGNNIP